MANIQTDQGWYADEYWVRQSAGVLGTIEQTSPGGSFTALTYRVNPSASECMTQGLQLLNFRDSGAFAVTNDEIYAFGIYGQNWHNFCFVSETQNAVARFAYVSSAYVEVTCQFYDETSGYYYGEWYGFGSIAQDAFAVPAFASVRDGLDAIAQATSVTTISKANTGYALAVWAKTRGYQSSADTDRMIPILISASQGAAHIQKDGQGGADVETVYEMEYAGRTLYMAMGSDTTILPEDLTATGAIVSDFTEACAASAEARHTLLFPLILQRSNFHWGEIDNPYAGGGTSEAGGGDGTFDFESTPVSFPGLPSVGGYDTGFTTMYNPTTAELKALANYMWAGAFDIENFRKLFADPMEAIIGLSIVPLTYSQIAGVSSSLYVGNISTGISMKRVSAQYVQVSCGTVAVPPKWGAYLDYAPYTKLQLYLPYIGFVDIAPDDVVGGSISVQYTIDLMSGTALASVMCKDHVLYCYGANCSCSCPVTSGQYKNGALGVLDGIGIAASTAAQMIPSVSDLKAGGVAANLVAAGASATAALAEGASKEFENVQAMMKPAISRSGSIGGPMGLMNIQIPYLVLTVPRMCIPGQQETYMGYPSFVTKQMGELSGYTEINVTHLNGMTCTAGEAEEIIALLGNGVIF